jgi:hypothetical protein
MDTPHTSLIDTDRQRLRTAVRLLVAAAALALVGIFGFGMFTGAGGYFDEATTDEALRDYYWQIWGILLPLAIATVISGVALLLMAGVLRRMRSGWTAAVTRVAQWVIVPATVLASVPYWMGPRGDDGPDLPSWLEPVSGIAGTLGYAAVLAMGVAIFGLPMPKWTGAALILGALAAYVTFLPLFVFVGTLAGGIGILRWNRKGLIAETSASPLTASGL